MEFQDIRGQMLGTATTGGTRQIKTDDNGNLLNKSVGKFISDEIILQNAVSATGNGTAIYMDSFDIFKITEISGTSTSRTIIFEVSNTENGTYSTIQGVRLSDLSMGTQIINLNEIWQIDGLAGLWFRTRVSAIAGGYVTIKGKKVT